jgi:hypothetical protein
MTTERLEPAVALIGEGVVTESGAVMRSVKLWGPTGPAVVL